MKELKDIANILRRDVLKMTTQAGSGHPTSCMSAAEIVSVLFFNEMRYDTKNSKNENNDEFVLSKGHAAPILYSALFRAGATKHDLMTLRQFGSPFEGHPLPSSFEWVKVGTGSLGQGVSVAVGMALAARREKKKYRTYVLIGDSEAAEGSIYEALELASYYKLDNLCIIADINRLGQSGQTMLGHNLNIYKKRFESFGCQVIEVDGHNVNQLLNAFAVAKRTKGKPAVILAKTFKGRGVSFLENKGGWHGKPVPEELLEKALGEIPNPKMPKFLIKKPTGNYYSPKKSNKKIKTNYKKGELAATRDAYGSALVKLDKLDYSLTVFDAEVKNSTRAQKLMKDKPHMFIESYIAEQNMVGMATGMAVRGHDTFCSTFAAFFSRAHDQIRMAALSNVNMTFVGSHAGVSIGQDGASQMGLSDIAMFRALPGSSVFYPSDAVSAEKIFRLATRIDGLTYVRTTREKTPVLYDNSEEFPQGDFKVLRKSSRDKCVIVGAGITLHNALKAYEKLKKQGISVAVVDCYSIKPFDYEKFRKFVKKHRNRVVTVEDHYIEGGIGEMISSGLSNTDVIFKLLAIREIPHSGKPEVLMKRYGIDENAIIKGALEITNN